MIIYGSLLTGYPNIAFPWYLRLHGVGDSGRAEGLQEMGVAGRAPGPGRKRRIARVYV
jgi:hypothetical protein